MTVAQYKVLRSLYAAVTSVGDAFGSECTSPGLIFPSRYGSLDDARRAFLPECWTVYPLGFEAFVARYARRANDSAVHAFVELAGHFPVEAAYVAPGDFNPAAHSRGAFTICLFLDAMESAGVRLLIAFDRVET